MSTELDLGGLHQPHDPDPAFVVLLEQRLESVLAGTAPSNDGPSSGDHAFVDLEPSVRAVRPQRPLLLVRAALGTAAAAVFVAALAVAVQRGDNAAVEPATTVGETPYSGLRNGWFAFVSDGPGDDDIYLVREGEAPRRVVVEGSDTAHETCPAFARDGRRLMFGRVTGDEDDGFRDPELVIVTVADDGSVAPETTIALDGMGAVPCAIWAPDGRWVAFGGADADNVVRGGTDGVWVVDTVTAEIRRLSGYHPNDLEWRPGTDELAITGDRSVNEVRDAPIDIYTVSTGDVRTVGDVQAANLTWSPDGTTIAYTGGGTQPDSGIWLVDADGTNERQLTTTAAPQASHGIGVVWSPRGDLIAYQRLCSEHPAARYERDHPDEDVGEVVPRICREQEEVVLVTATDNNSANPIGTEQVIAPPLTDGPGGPSWWFPFSVIWTPDGTHLLYTAWSDGPGEGGVVAVPVDASQPPIVLTGELGPNAYVGTPWIPLQPVAGTGPLGALTSHEIEPP